MRTHPQAPLHPTRALARAFRSRIARWALALAGLAVVSAGCDSMNPADDVPQPDQALSQEEATSESLQDTLASASKSTSLSAPVPHVWADGYAWANQPTASSYAPSSNYAHNSSGGAIRITRAGTGRYTVRFDGLGSIMHEGGNVQVTAYGSSNEYCKVVSWTGNLSVSVRCFRPGGYLTDTRYTVLVISARARYNIGYAWADRPTTSSYTPSSFYAYNAAGGAPQITRAGPGRYTVGFPGLGSYIGHGGNVQVTAYGSGAEQCKVVSWGGDLVYVRCFNASGALVNTRFTVLFSGQGYSMGYTWANQPTTSSYAPSSYYAYNSSGGAIRITRAGTGRYTVYFDNLSTRLFSGGNVQVTAYGSTGEQCKVAAWSTSAAVYVRCFSASGSLVDTRYTVLIQSSFHH